MQKLQHQGRRVSRAMAVGTPGDQRHVLFMLRQAQRWKAQARGAGQAAAHTRWGPGDVVPG